MFLAVVTVVEHFVLWYRESAITGIMIFTPTHFTTGKAFTTQPVFLWLEIVLLVAVQFQAIVLPPSLPATTPIRTTTLTPANTPMTIVQLWHRSIKDLLLPVLLVGLSF